MIAFHSREHLIQIFRSCYEDTRDVKQVLTKITKIPGYVKLTEVHASKKIVVQC